jgi:hypothetical protein
MDELYPPYTWKRPLLRFLWGWRLRHRHPVNFWLHLVGIPLVMTGVILLIAWNMEDWYWLVPAIILGYVLQFIGHTVEGNDLGEWAAIKRLLGLPYVSIAPRPQQTENKSLHSQESLTASV